MSPSLLQIIILSLIQGAAEPLPVSSSAHVIAAEKLMHLDPAGPEMTFLLAMLHTGTIAAVVAYFWKAWKSSFFSSRAQLWGTFTWVASATVATLLVYFILEFLIKRVVFHGRPGAEVEDLFSNLTLIAAALVAGGILILVAGLRTRTLVPHPASERIPGRAVPAGAAVWIGAAQGLCLPFRGLSRSGATISTGMLLKIPRLVAEEFSFALAVVITPPVIAREFYRFYKFRAAGAAPVSLPSLVEPGLVGMACSFLAGLLALRLLTRWLERGRWHYFGIYCFAAALGVFTLARMGY